MAKKVVSVKYLQSFQFSSLTKAEKLEVKEIGRPTPNLEIEQRGANKNYTFTRKFSSDFYKISIGCVVVKKLMQSFASLAYCSVGTVLE